MLFLLFLNFFGTNMNVNDRFVMELLHTSLDVSLECTQPRAPEMRA